MPLTASEHQKISALQQIANLVGQAQSVAGNQAVLQNVINSSLPLISQWERSDPEFQELAIQMRRARVDPAPHNLMNIAGQAQRMIAMVRGVSPVRRDWEGDPVVWDPIRGSVTSPMFDPNEPVRTFSPGGWRGSKKHPWGKAFPTKNMIEGLGDYGSITGTISSVFTTAFKVAALISGSILAIHGYEKNNRSVPMGVLWGVIGGAFWPISLFIMYQQGFAGNWNVSMAV